MRRIRLGMPDSQQPILRWLGSWSPYQQHSPNASRPPSPSSTPPSPSLASLNEALRESLLPAKPPLAKLPQGFYTSKSLSRPPPFLDNLTRSTLPTSSLSPPLATVQSSPPPSPSCDDLDLQTPPIVLTHSPPTRTSLDTLRSVSFRDHARSGSLGSVRSASTAASLSFRAQTPEEPASSSTNWWWFQSENKENVDGMLGDEDRAETVQEEQQHIRNKYRSPNNPVVFCHGLLGFDSVTIGLSIAPVQVTHWRGIKEVLEANGTEVLITRVPATSSPIDRAKVLVDKINEVYPGRSVHLIGHSMGGLDCRYLTSHLPRKFDVLSVTTIATPHRGSSFADHFLSTLGKARMPGFLSLLDLLPNGGGDGKAFDSLTLDSMRKFNEEVRNVEGVKYFSWGAVYEPGFVDTWKWPHGVILEKEGPNDGLVSVESAKWGTYLGTIQNVNHLDLVGWTNPARYKWAEMMGKEIEFRPVTFYLGVVDMLAREVEGIGEKAGGDHDQAPSTGPSDAEPSEHKAQRHAEREEERHKDRVEEGPSGSNGSAVPQSQGTPPVPRRSLDERLSQAVKAKGKAVEGRSTGASSRTSTPKPSQKAGES